jgi:hypothetical protein
VVGKLSCPDPPHAQSGEKTAETRPGQAAAFISRNSLCICAYTFVTSPALANGANARPLQATVDTLPRRFFCPSSAAPTAPFGPEFLASPYSPKVSPRSRRTRTSRQAACHTCCGPTVWLRRTEDELRVWRDTPKRGHRPPAGQKARARFKG